MEERWDAREGRREERVERTVTACAPIWHIVAQHEMNKLTGRTADTESLSSEAETWKPGGGVLDWGNGWPPLQSSSLVFPLVPFCCSPAPASLMPLLLSVPPQPLSSWQCRCSQPLCHVCWLMQAP